MRWSSLYLYNVRYMYVCKYLWNKSGLKAKVTRQTIIWRTVMVLFLELFRESGSFFYRWHFLCIKVINTPEISKTYEICKGIIFYKPSLEHALLMVWCISPVAKWIWNENIRKQLLIIAYWWFDRSRTYKNVFFQQ